MKPQKLILNKDFKYSFPYGQYTEPQIEVLQGEYKGLKFDIMTSGISKSSDEPDHKLTYTFKILKTWETMDTSKIQGETLLLDSDDNKYIGELVYNFIKVFNKRERKK